MSPGVLLLFISENSYSSTSSLLNASICCTVHLQGYMYTYLFWLLYECRLISEKKTYLSFWECFVSLSTMVSSQDHFVASGKWLCGIPQSVSSQFLYVFLFGHHGCFHISTVVDCAAINIGLLATFSYEHFIHLARLSGVG